MNAADVRYAFSAAPALIIFVMGLLRLKKALKRYGAKQTAGRRQSR